MGDRERVSRGARGLLGYCAGGAAAGTTTVSPPLVALIAGAAAGSGAGRAAAHVGVLEAKCRRRADDDRLTIRLLDPPLHEFLPHERAQQDEVARSIGANPERLRSRVNALSESNPMLGHRGCRLGITHPEITEMQARAILEAASIAKKDGVSVRRTAGDG